MNNKLDNPVTHIFIAIVLLWLINLVVGLQYPTDSRGTFGDMFGSLNALFSGFAFVGVIYAILLQREELKQTSKELLGQKQELEASNKLREHQGFENTFFQILTVLQSIINSMDLTGFRTKAIEKSGRDCFKAFISEYNIEYKQQLHENSPSPYNASYNIIYKRYKSDLGHYYRTLYNLVKLVDQSRVSEKKFYTNIIRAQMSDYEVALLFLNCQSELGIKKFKPLVEKYSLLKVMDKSLVEESELLMSKYAAKAFE